MKKLSLHLIRAVLAVMMVGAIMPSAAADVIIDFTGLPANHENGTYNGFVSGDIAGIPFDNLICDDYYPFTFVPSSLDYTVSTLSSLTNAKFVATPGHPTNTEIQNYETAAILIYNMIQDPAHETAQYQYALWHLFSPTVQPYGDSASLLATAQAQALQPSIDHSTIYSELLIYSPGHGVSAQEFLQLDPTTPVPEPYSLFLIGTGLSLVGVFMRRRLQSAASARTSP